MLEFLDVPGIDDNESSSENVFGTGDESVRPPSPAAGFPVDDKTQASPPPDITQQVGRSSSTPEKIGRYVVLDRIGAGGMAEVFLAKQDGPAGFEKTVVIKRSFPHLAENTRYIDMFMREAKIAARLNHPNVVQIYDFGQDEDLYFIAMEFVDGLTLHRLAKRAWRVGRSLPMEVIVRAMADAALGLNHAHNLRGTAGELVQLVHRDISPDNLMINREGVTKVLDFGIAKAADTQSVTRSGEIKGKIPFMSPEQVKGFDVDGRSDIYSLGICFYWMLTGKRPFQGSSDFVTMQAVIEEHAERPSHFNPSVPPEIDAIVMRMIAKEAVERFQSGQDLHEELMNLVDNASRVSSQALVADLMNVGSSEDNDANPPTQSEGFLPATPVSARLSQPSIQSAVARQPKLAVPLGIAASLAVVMGVVLLAVFAIGHDEELQPPNITAPVIQVPEPPEQIEVEEVVDDGEEILEALVEDGAELVEDGEEFVDDGEEEGEEVVEDREDCDPSKPKPIRRPKVSKQRVTLKGPGYVRFHVGKWVAAGSASVSPRTKSIRARDNRYGVVVHVPISNGVADWNALPTGHMAFRVYPWADVIVGGTKIGKTPLPGPVKLVAGTYSIKFVYDGQTQTQTVSVRAGTVEQVKAKF